MGTFATVFIILFFIFILQTVWLFIAELAGKDLDFILILKFLAFSMPGIVPLVLPLSILLASIMTFGDLSENYEFAAMKSSGVSLQRAMRGLTVFILLLSVAAFAFANNIIPYAQYRFINFKANIAQVKPAMAIAEGQFNDVGGFNIKVDKKSGEKGNYLTGVTIHKKSVNGSGNTTVIKAKKGELLSNEDSNILQLVLFDGYQYEDVPVKNYNERDKVPFTKTSFERYNMNMDLSKLNQVDIEKEKIANTSSMLNIKELNYTLDSLNTAISKDLVSFADNIHTRSGTGNFSMFKKDSVPEQTPKDLLANYATSDMARILEVANSNVNSTKFTITGTRDDLNFKQKNINSHWLSLYDKFVISYACILMFFIGAPLGAIIRKGGLGLPIVFAVLIFITFHFINTFGKKVAQENGITPFLGAWLSSIVLTPLALTFTYRATKDMNLSINFDWLTEPFARIFGRGNLRPVFDFESRFINFDTTRIIEDEQFRSFEKMTNEELEEMVYNSKKLHFDDRIRNKALLLLDRRGITQETLFEQKRLFNEDFEQLDDAAESYTFNSKVTFFLFFIVIIMGLVAKNNPSQVWTVIATVVLLIIFYISSFKTGQRLAESAKVSGYKLKIHPILQTVLSFPFYIFFHFFNKRQLSKMVNDSNF